MDGALPWSRNGPIQKIEPGTPYCYTLANNANPNASRVHRTLAPERPKHQQGGTNIFVPPQPAPTNRGDRTLIL